ncbi:MAG TPA: DUF4926 domain-containing protein [Xanthobacteraceae bacterium]|nr:DUF4926 domain-containing protein [Xanthobacteraceae bacterium]
MMTTIELLDVVALTADRLDEGLLREQVGTVVETLAPGVYEVEFSDDQGYTYAELALREDQLLVLRDGPQQAA